MKINFLKNHFALVLDEKDLRYTGLTYDKSYKLSIKKLIQNSAKSLRATSVLSYKQIVSKQALT